MELATSASLRAPLPSEERRGEELSPLLSTPPLHDLGEPLEAARVIKSAQKGVYDPAVFLIIDIKPAAGGNWRREGCSYVPDGKVTPLFIGRHLCK
jgi:hypothetical protein